MKKRIVVLSIVAIVLSVNYTLAETKATPAEKARENLENYFKAWDEPDAVKREAILNPSWAENGTYTDPTVHVAGRDALVAHIEGFASGGQTKTMSIVRTTGVDFHHRSFRFGWEMQNASGKTLTSGFDYGEFNDEGQITKIVGFFGPMPKMK